MFCQESLNCHVIRRDRAGAITPSCPVLRYQCDEAPHCYQSTALSVVFITHLEIIMKVLSFCFCKDADGHVGLARGFDHGFLTVLFDDGERRVRPNEVTFL